MAHYNEAITISWESGEESSTDCRISNGEESPQCLVEVVLGSTKLEQSKRNVPPPSSNVALPYRSRVCHGKRQLFQHFDIPHSKQPATMVTSIEAVLVKAIESMSSIKLQQSFSHDTELKKLFHEALLLQLPATAENKENAASRKEARMDALADKEGISFELGGSLWSIELYRNGAIMNPKDQEYSLYPQCPTKNHLVVDFRGPRTHQAVTAISNRCTLYFDADFARVEIQMRFRPIVAKNLKG